MSGVRVLVGTRKGAFVLSSDGRRARWDVSVPHRLLSRTIGLEADPAVRRFLERRRAALRRGGP
jgi:hypothetical protein